MANKIYTKTGDNGTSGLIGGKRYGKDELVFEALGRLDELMAFLGFAYPLKNNKLTNIIQEIQTELFEIGAIVAGQKISKKYLEKIGARVKHFESEIDTLDNSLTPLKNFILPGVTYEATYLHYCRTLCRSTERKIVLLINKNKRTELKDFSVYLNRLADYLFTLARYYNKKGRADIKWKGSFSEV